jgi:hypothetical protein
MRASAAPYRRPSGPLAVNGLCRRAQALAASVLAVMIRSRPSAETSTTA